MGRIFHPLLFLLARCTRNERIRQMEWLKAENEILRKRVDKKRIFLDQEEKSRLMKLGKAIGSDLKHIINIVSYSTYLSWLRKELEKYASLLPSMLLGLSYGGFGGGVGDTVGNFNDRLDVDVSAVWEIRNFGRGDAAAQDVAQAQIEQARYREIETMDRISREIVEARSQVKSRKRRINTSRTAVSTAQQSYARNRQRINEGLGLPIEFLQSLQALDQAQREYLRSVTDFNVAQFHLHHALGWPSDAAIEPASAKIR